MKHIVGFVVIVVFFTVLALLLAAANFVGDNYSDVLGPVFIFVGLAAAIIYALKGK